MIFLAQADVLEAFARLDAWQVVAFLAACVMVILFYWQRGNYRRIDGEARRTESESETTRTVMEQNRDLTQGYIAQSKVISQLEEKLSKQNETLVQQNKQSEATTQGMLAAVEIMRNLQRGQEHLIDKVQASLLAAEGSIEIMTAIKENTEALAIKTDLIQNTVEADTGITQSLIIANTDKAIQFIKEAYEGVSSSMIRFEKLLAEVSHIHPCAELGEISIALKDIQARLDAQKVVSNETFTPTVDLHVPVDGKSGNGTGDTAIDPSTG